MPAKWVLDEAGGAGFFAVGKIGLSGGIEVFAAGEFASSGDLWGI